MAKALLMFCKDNKMRGQPVTRAWGFKSADIHRKEVVRALPVAGMCVHGQGVKLQDGPFWEQVWSDLDILHGPPEKHWQHWSQAY